jgi:hypothetical protein
MPASREELEALLFEKAAQDGDYATAAALMVCAYELSRIAKRLEAVAALDSIGDKLADVAAAIQEVAEEVSHDEAGTSVIVPMGGKA